MPPVELRAARGAERGAAPLPAGPRKTRIL